MADNNTLGLDFVINDATKPGLNSAWNNVTQMTNKMAKELELDVTVKFPEIAGQIAGFEKQMKDANKQIGKFVFGGQRYDKSKKHLLDDSFIFDYTSKKGKLDYDTIKNDILPKLELIKSGLADGFVKSGDIMGVGAKKEAESLRKLVETLTNVKKAYELVLRTQAKFNTQASTRSADIGKAEKTQTGKIRLADINTSIANAKNLHFEGQSEGDLQKQIKAHQKLNQLYRDRFTITKKAKDLERAQSYQAGVRELEKQLKAQQEAAKHAKNKLEYEKLFGVEAQKSAAKLKPQADILSNLRSLATRYLSVFTVARFGKEIAETTKYFEQQQVALEGILGSASAASDAIGKIKTMALESPLQTKELITDVKQLAAYGIEQEKLLDTTKQLADISIGLGVSMDRLILAYGQVKAASVLRGQELRQFTEAGIPLVQALADKFTELNGRVVTTGEVFKFISQRKVSFEMVASVLSDMTKEGGKFYKMQERMTDTLYGQMEKTADMWTLAKNSLGEMMHGPLMAVVKALQLVVKNAKGFLITITTPLIIQSLHRMSGYFDMMRANAGRIPQIMRRTNALMSVATTSARKWHIAMAGISVAANAAMGAITLGATILVGVISNAVLKTKEFRSAMEGVGRDFDKDTQNMIRGLDSLLYKLAANSKGTKEFNEALETLKNNYKDFINPAVIDQLIAERREINEGVKSWGNLREAIIGAIEARKDYERHKSMQQTAGDKLLERADFERTVKYMGFTSETIKENRYEAEGVLRRAYESFISKGLTVTKENGLVKNAMLLENEISKEAKRSGVPNVGKELISKLPAYYDWLGLTGEEYDRYASELAAKKKSPYYTIDTRFEAARKRVTSGKDKNVEAISAVKDLVAIGVKFINDKDVSSVEDYKAALSSLNDAISSDFDAGKTNRVATALKNVIDIITDEENRGHFSDISRQFQEMVDINTGITEIIANNIEKYIKANNATGKEAEFLRKYMPTDETRNKLRDDIISSYRENRDFIKAHKSDGAWASEVKEREQEQKWLSVLMSSSMYDIDPTQLKGYKGGGKAYSGFTHFFSDMFGLIKSAYNDQKKLVEGSEGVTNSLVTSINELSDDNILKAFYQEGKNPFKPVLDKIENYDLETIFSAGDFENLSTQFLRGIGVDKITMADFEGLWDSLLNVVKGKAQSLRLEGKTKDASKVEAYYQQMVAEGIKFFGKNEIEKKIDEVIKSLTNIQNTAQLNSDMFNDMKEMMKTGNYLDVWKAMNPGMEYRDRNEATTAQQTLSQMLSASPAMFSYLGASLDGILKAEKLGVSLLPELYNIIQKVNDIGDFDPEELKKQKDLFIEALKALINGIKEETKKLSDTRTNREKTADGIDNTEKDVEDSMERLDKALKNGEISEGQYSDRMAEIRQKRTSEISGLLGGQYNNDIAKITKDSNSATGSSKKGDFAQLMSAMQGGLGDLIATGAGQAAAKGQITGAEASAIAEGAAGAIAMVDMIIKAVYGAIKAISEMAKKTLELMQSYDDVTTISIDEVGVMHVETKYGGYNFEKANAIIDSIEQFNQHVMDGWEKVKSGDLLGSFAEIYNSYLDLIISIRKIADKDLEKLIEGMQKTGQDIDNAATNLNAAAERMVGFDKMVTQLAATGKSLEAAQNYKNMIDAETAMKLSDPDKMREWQQQYMEALNEFKNGIRELRNELVSSTEDWSSALSQAMREAFQNGENAMRNFRDVAKTMIGDIVENMLQMSILEPLIENAIQAWTNSDALMEKYTISYLDKNGYTQKTFDQDSFLRDLLKNITDPDKTDQFYSDVLTAGEAYLNAINNMPQSMQDYFKYNSSLSSLSGGIQNETEDTARRLEALANSQLGETIVIRKSLESMAYDVTALPTIQAEAVRMNSTLAAMLAVSQAIHNDINDMRNNVRPLWVRM